MCMSVHMYMCVCACVHIRRVLTCMSMQHLHTYSHSSCVNMQIYPGWNEMRIYLLHLRQP